VADKYEPIPYEEGGGNPEVRKVRTQYAHEKVRLTTAHKSLHIALESERKVLAARNTDVAHEAYLKQWIQGESKRLTELSDAELLSQLGSEQAETLAVIQVDRITLHQMVLAYRAMDMREYLKDRNKYQQRAVDVLQSRLNREYSPGMLKSMYKYINHLHLAFMEEDRATSVYDKIMSVMRRVGYGPLASAAAKSLAAEFDMTNREIFATFFGSPKV
jgi:Rps23 Pro-64 3,4-dihydroxylase Tpa1-like proline 4-hydroxylase